MNGQPQLILAAQTEQDPPGLSRAVRLAMDAHIRPYLQAHGGDVEVVGINNGVVNIRMFAACGACELKPVTFSSRVRAEILRVPGVREVTCASVPFTPKRLDRIADFFAVTPSISSS
jgi:Fe-S cluster biogenesis protein NfuA